MTSRATRRAWSTFLCSALVAPAASVRADPDVNDARQADARSLAVDGRAAFTAGECERAVALFRKAYTLLPAPTISVYEARALTCLGRLVEAKAVYERTAQTSIDPDGPEQFARAVGEAKAELGELAPRIPRLVLSLQGGDAGPARSVVYLDGHVVPPGELGVERFADPGQHRATARRPGLPDSDRDFVLFEGGILRVELRAAGEARAVPAPSTDWGHDSAPPAGASPRRLVMYGAFGLGAVGVGTGIVIGLVAAGRHAELAQECPDHECVDGSPGAEGLDDFHRLRTLSTTGYVVGALGIGTGLTLLFTEQSSGAKRAALGLFVGSRSVGLRGEL